LTKDVFNFRFRIQAVNCPAYKIDIAAKRRKLSKK
jgi:hypothetical protein